MSTLKSVDFAEILGFTPVCRISDKEVWNNLLTPLVKALLGPITKPGENQLFETEQGHFPGDEASNLNNHLLYGGKSGYVRHPYISACHRTAEGALVVKRDFRKLRVTAWVGDVYSGKAKPVYYLGLRDRRYDGTPTANDCALLSFRYNDPIYSQVLHRDLRALELSIYSFWPDFQVVDVTGDPEFAQFVEKPFTFADKPEVFLKHFDRVWKTKISPGQVGAPLRDVSRLLLPQVEQLASKYRYDVLEAACSHYHVAMWFSAANKYRYSYQQDADTMTKFSAGLKAIRDSGTPLTRPQQSWVCVLQNLHDEKSIPAHLRIVGAIWPQDNISPESLWVNKPLSSKALSLLPNPLPVKIPPAETGKSIVSSK